MDFQMALVFLGATASKVSKFDWSRLIPRLRVDKYKYGAAGIELTWPWRSEGFGLGLGLGTIDIWLGWPKSEENLHNEECKHPKVAAPVDS